ncbi:MAG: response regulator, partial [candidate division Zixibacteria bacterium]|nr:response regulator [candidate division Zixibacteria bacterium]
STRSVETKERRSAISSPHASISKELAEGGSSLRSISHILVVDDEEYICEVIKELLSNEGYQIQTMCDPQKAIEFIKDQPVDLVLTDLIMGKKSGVDVLNQTMKFHPDAIVILMTGHPTIENAVAVLKSGAYDYLVKPFSMDTLKAVIKRGLEKQRLYRENINLKETVSLYKISEAMGSTIRLDFLLNLILETAIKELDADMASVLLLDEKTKRLTPEASLGVPSEMAKSGLLTGQDNISRWVIKQGRPRVFDKDEIGERFSSHHLRKNVRSVIVHPLMAKGKVIGTLILIRSKGRISPFTTGQLHSLSIIASKAASAIENSRLYEELKESYLETLTTLANAVEARDIYTRGHTERVCYMAELMGSQMGWNEERLWEVKMGGILHDIGKIGVPDAILNKAEALTKDEFEVMKQHPICGAKILEGISFLAPAVPYVLYHHERFDGKGYPYGLRNDRIPIQGRLMAVVDTFDAMTSDRPYRKAKSFKIALKEIRDCAGTQFDPHIAEVFLDAWERGLIDKRKLKVKKES